MAFEGALDVCSDDLVAGWAWDRDHPGQRLAIELIVDGTSLARMTADQYRPDLEAAHIGDGRYAFNYSPLSRLGLGGRTVRAVVAGADFTLPRSRPAADADRRERITRHITPQQRGIEIGPYFNPLAPKRLGYDCLVLDVFDADTLRRHAREDANIPDASIADIEEVDLVGSGIEIAERVAEKYPLGSFDYILSSHNFEHLPDPIRFLQGCEKVLRPGGVLSMAIPDRRASFDYFRPHSMSADLLQAYFEARTRPSPAQIFSHHALHCRYVSGQDELLGFSIDWDPSNIVPLETVEQAFNLWKTEASDNISRNVHCWTFTPASLELILWELRFLNLIGLEVREVTEPSNNEFYVHLENFLPEEQYRISPEDFYRKRRDLLRSVVDEAGYNSLRAFSDRRRLAG